MLRAVAETARAIRVLRASPATSTAIVLTTAVAIGINLAMVDLVQRSLFSPPSGVVAPERIFELDYETGSSSGEPMLSAVTSYTMYEAIRRHVTSLEAVSAWFEKPIPATINGEDLQPGTLLVTGDYFSMLGARPELGRVLEPDDDRTPDGSPVAVVSHAFWRSKFSGDRGILGRQVRLYGVPYVIVGVMPSGFSGHSTDRVDLWIPLHAGMREMPRWESLSTVVIGGRLATEATAAVAATQASAASGRRVVLTSIAQGDERRNPVLYWLSAVSGLLFVIGLANTATLLLVQRSHRRREYSVRAALGATRGRFVRTIAGEAAMLSAVATVVALILGAWFADVVRYFLLPSLVERAGWDPRSYGAAVAAGLVTLVVATVVGVAQLPSLVRAEHLTGGIGRLWRRSGAQSELILIQTTLAVMLVAGAGVFARSYRQAATEDVGLRMDDLFLVGLDSGGFNARQDDLLTAVAGVLRNVPGIIAVTPVQTLPFTGLEGIPVSVPGVDGAVLLDGYEPQLYAATPELFEMLRLRLVEGRRLTAQDDSGAPVALVNETMARTLWPRGAIGRCFRAGIDPDYDPVAATSPPIPPLSVPCRQVVGVVGDVRQQAGRGWTRRLMQYYVPISQTPTMPRRMGPRSRIHRLLVEARGGTARVTAIIRGALPAGHLDIPPVRVVRYADLLKPSPMGMALLALFGALALAVAGVGLYATFAQAVVERRRELAIRLAIGAPHRGVMRMILGEGLALAMRGVVCGCVTAAIAGRWVESFLFGTTPSDPLVLGLAAAVMLLVAVAGTLIPARNAARTDLGLLLRGD